MNAAGIDVEPPLLNIKRNGEALKEVQCFKFLCRCFSCDGGVKRDVRLGDGNKVWGNDEVFAGQKSEFNSKARYIYERG